MRLNAPGPKHLTPEELATAWRDDDQLAFHIILDLPWSFAEGQHIAATRTSSSASSCCMALYVSSFIRFSHEKDRAESCLAHSQIRLQGPKQSFECTWDTWKDRTKLFV